jgi:murein DD-endopeptidase MepM/ murein hydrolase activator NlpD
MSLFAVLLFLAGPVDLRLTTSPRHVYKENDGRDGHGDTESFVFRLIVREAQGGAAEPTGATIELRAGTHLVRSLRLSGQALSCLRERPGSLSADADAAFAVKLAFINEPVAEGIDRVAVRLEAGTAVASLIVPVGDYGQKTTLRFPLRGDFLVVTGHVSAAQGHEERSQQFAYDIVALGPGLELLKGEGAKNEDFVGFGREVLAPGDGTVAYARNDVADNPSTGNQDMASLLALADPPWGVAGNCVVIDHGNGEWSLLAHMKKGSVVVKKGDRIKQGDHIGDLGNSGATTGPHLHYHLMDGARLLLSDGLPARFENTCHPMPKPGVYCDTR